MSRENCVRKAVDMLGLLHRAAPGVTLTTVEVPEALFNRLGARVVDDLQRAQRMLQMRIRNANILALRASGQKVVAIAAELGVSEHIVWDVIRRKAPKAKSQ